MVQVQGSLVVEEGTNPEELIGKTVGELFGLSVDNEEGTIVAEIVDDEAEEDAEEDAEEGDVSAQQGASLEDNIVASSALFPFSHGLTAEEQEDMAEMLVENDVLMHRAAAVITVTGRDEFEYEVLRMLDDEGGDGEGGEGEGASAKDADSDEASTSGSSKVRACFRMMSSVL